MVFYKYTYEIRIETKNAYEKREGMEVHQVNKNRKAKKKQEGKIKRWFDERDKKVHGMFGGPSDYAWRDWVLFIGGIVYLVSGILGYINPTNIVASALGLEEIGIKIISVVLMIGGVLLLACWLFVLTIRLHRNNKENCLTKLLYGVSVLVLYLFYLIKQIVFYFLRKTGQKNVMAYIAEIIASFFITFFVVLLLVANNTVGQIVHSISGWLLWDELLAFIYVFIAIVMFFGISRWFIRITVKLEIWTEQKWELKKVSSVGLRDVMRNEDSITKREKRYEERKKVLDEEIKNTEIWFFVVVTLVLLIIPVDETNTIGKLFVSEFMGITTLFALTREVRTNIKDTPETEDKA